MKVCGCEMITILNSSALRVFRRFAPAFYKLKYMSRKEPRNGQSAAQRVSATKTRGRVSASPGTEVATGRTTRERSAIVGEV